MKIRNLALGRRVEITEHVPMKNSFGCCEKDNKNCLTDGIFAKCEDKNGWMLFCRGIGRTFSIDLGGVYAVCGINLGFLHDREINVFCPEKVRFMLSENGIDFHEIALVPSPYPPSFAMKARAVYSESFASPLRARYIKLEFFIENHVCCDEIRVFGAECDGTETLLTGEPVKLQHKNSYASADCLGGVRNITSFDFGRRPRDEVLRIEKNDFKSYLAYLDKDGNPIDTMFDSVLLKPLRFAPSGGTFTYGGAASKLSDWEFLIDELFSPNYNLRALDDAVDEIKSVLSLRDDYKLKVYLSAPIPKISLEHFGDFNGDGIEEKLLSVDDCTAAFAWFVDAVARRFDAECLMNLTIDGWCWNDTAFDRLHNDDNEILITQCVSVLKARGYKSIAVPFFQAGGTEKTEKIGFDCVAMGPLNLTSGVDFSDFDSMLSADYAETCRRYGFGTEFQLHGGILKDTEYIDWFNKYLRAYLQNGMMGKTIHVFTNAASVNPLSECARSGNSELRAVYDKVYRFIEGTLTESDFEAKDETAEISEKAALEPVSDGESVFEEAMASKEARKPSADNPEKKEQCKTIKKYALGASFAAAALGAVYLIKKIKNGWKD